MAENEVQVKEEQVQEGTEGGLRNGEEMSDD